MEPKPEENVPSEPERGPEDVELDDLQNTVGGRSVPVYGVISVESE